MTKTERCSSWQSRGDPALVTALGLSKLVPEKAVIKEVMKEASKTAVETVSPISYAALGIGILLMLLAAAVFFRSKKIVMSK